jgi:TetR/AcrR family transcriptional repressor of bet genes
LIDQSINPWQHAPTEVSIWQKHRGPRRKDLVEATIHEIGAAGSLDVTVGQIAKRAGVSPALAFHYFGGKDRLFLAAMRAILSVYGAEVRGALMTATRPAHPAGGHDPRQFRAVEFPEGGHLRLAEFLRHGRDGARGAAASDVYQRRLRSNLLHGLRPLAGPRAPEIAERIAGLIDGLYLRAALDTGALHGARAAAHVLAALAHGLEAAE